MVKVYKCPKFPLLVSDRNLFQSTPHWKTLATRARDFFPDFPLEARKKQQQGRCLVNRDQGSTSGPMFSLAASMHSLLRSRLLRVVFTPSIRWDWSFVTERVKTTRSNRLKFRLIWYLFALLNIETRWLHVVFRTRYQTPGPLGV